MELAKESVEILGKIRTKDQAPTFRLNVLKGYPVNPTAVHLNIK